MGGAACLLEGHKLKGLTRKDRGQEMGGREGEKLLGSRVRKGGAGQEHCCEEGQLRKQLHVQRRGGEHSWQENSLPSALSNHQTLWVSSRSPVS